MSEFFDAVPIVSVSELTHALREVVGGTFGEVGVRGELGRVTYHGSGHIYLSLKDADAVLSARRRAASASGSKRARRWSRSAASTSTRLAARTS